MAVKHLKKIAFENDFIAGYVHFYCMFLALSNFALSTQSLDTHSYYCKVKPLMDF